MLLEDVVQLTEALLGEVPHKERRREGLSWVEGVRTSRVLKYVTKDSKRCLLDCVRSLNVGTAPRAVLGVSP